MKSWLKEPLLHFLVVGGLLFAAYALLNRGEVGTPQTIRITAAEINWIKETWTRQWQRPPTEDEMRGLAAGHLRETLLAREAKDVGLGENDTVIRRRLAQKMEFLVQDTARIKEPGDEELRKFHSINADRYRSPARASFQQIFFKTEAAAQKGLTQLANRRPEELGDPSMLERTHVDTEMQAVSSQFGDRFSRQIFSLEAGKWHGPVPSSYGYHLVKIDAFAATGPQAFETVRQQVLIDWQRDQQARAEARFLAALQKKYNVVIDEEIKSMVGPLAELAR
jgi:PPIC-type PPIASE domain